MRTGVAGMAIGMSIKTSFRTFIIGAASGAAALYLADPERGRQRRRDLRSQADSAAERFGVDLDDAADTLRDRAQDVASTAAEALKERGLVPDTDPTQPEGTPAPNLR